MYSKDELLAKSPEELETIAKALGSNLTAADGVEALASYIIGDFDFDAEKEEKPKRKTRTKTTVSDEEPTEEAPKKKRGRPSKKALEEAAALAAQKAQEELEQITETEASTPEEGTEEIVAPAPKKRRARRTKEEILAAAQAKAEALSLNNQKKAVVQRELEFEENEHNNNLAPSNDVEVPDFLKTDTNSTYTESPEDETVITETSES